MKTLYRRITKYVIWFLWIFAMVALVVIFLKHSEYSESEYYFDDENVQEWSEGWEVRAGNSTMEGLTLPAQLPVSRGDALILRNVLPDKIKTYNCIMLEGRRQDIEVSINGIQRASFSNKNYRPWGQTSPSGIVLVPLYNTDSRADVVIRITTDSVFSGKIGNVYLGNEKSLVLRMLKENVPSFYIAIIVFILGLVCLVSYYSYTATFDISRAIICLALFAFSSSIWSFSQSGLRQIFLDDLSLLEDIGYCAYLVLPVPFMLYVNWVTEKRYKAISDSYILLATLNFVVENIVQFVLGKGFYEMRFANQVVLVIGIGIVLYVCAMENQGKNKILVAHLLVGVLGFSVGLITEIVSQNFFFEANKVSIVNTIYIVGMAIFLFTSYLYTLRCVNEEQRRIKDAESANKAKTNFLASMSHEIKTPINAILGMNEMIMRDSVEDTVLEYSANIGDAGKSLLSLVNDILDYSKIESGKMEIVSENYKLKPLLRDLIAMVKNKINSQEVSLVLEIDENIPSVFYGDGIRLKQVLSNLLTNAAKYTEKGSITFCVTGQGIKDDVIDLYFSIKDTGIGISKEDIEKIMESFNRGKEETNSSTSGAGLGLTITKQLLELMGSTLEVDSVYGEGSEFYFVLKQRIVDTAPIGSFKPKTEIVQSKHKITFTAPEARVLAVDDTVMNLKVLSHLLKPTNIQLDTCDSGKECLELCKDTYYDIIIMDHMMPEMDGIEAFKNIRANKELASTESPVIVLTANTVSGAEEMYLSEGFDYYMKKPVDVIELNDVVMRFLPPEKIKPMTF